MEPPCSSEVGGPGHLLLLSVCLFTELFPNLFICVVLPVIASRQQVGKQYLILWLETEPAICRRGDGEVVFDEDVERYAEQLLVLSHAYSVPWLKRWCTEAIGSRLTPGTVVDALQLADLCDAPQLHLRCMRLLAKEFRAVERTEAWRFLRENDPWQELDVLSRLHDADMVSAVSENHVKFYKSCGSPSIVSALEVSL